MAEKSQKISEISKKSSLLPLDKAEKGCYNINTSARALFLCPLFKTEGGNKLEVPKNENQDYVGLQ